MKIYVLNARLHGYKNYRIIRFCKVFLIKAYFNLLQSLELGIDILIKIKILKSSHVLHT